MKRRIITDNSKRVVKADTPQKNPMVTTEGCTPILTTEMAELHVAIQKYEWQKAEILLKAIILPAINMTVDHKVADAVIAKLVEGPSWSKDEYISRFRTMYEQQMFSNSINEQMGKYISKAVGKDGKPIKWVEQYYKTPQQAMDEMLQAKAVQQFEKAHAEFVKEVDKNPDVLKKSSHLGGTAIPQQGYAGWKPGSVTTPEQIEAMLQVLGKANQQFEIVASQVAGKKIQEHMTKNGLNCTIHINPNIPEDKAYWLDKPNWQTFSMSDVFTQEPIPLKQHYKFSENYYGPSPMSDLRKWALLGVDDAKPTVTGGKQGSEGVSTPALPKS